MSELFESFVPARGALIDIYGPGTVFHMIRQREIARLTKLKKRGLAYNTPTTSVTGKTITVFTLILPAIRVTGKPVNE